MRRGVRAARSRVGHSMLPLSDRLAGSRIGVDALPVPRATLICIRRQKNEGVIARLLDEAESSGFPTAIWDLDQGEASSARHSIGSGPGLRTDLLNELLLLADPPTDHYLVIADDDVAFAASGLTTLLRLVAEAQLDIAQPAHCLDSHASHRITIARPWSVVRRTGYVEIGPMVVISPAFRDRVLPFPEDFGMGWGLEVRWSELQHDGCNLGIVDLVRVRHLSAPMTEYEAATEKERVAHLVGDGDMESFAERNGTQETWRPWQPHPRWST